MALFSKKQQNMPRRRQTDLKNERATDSEREERYTFRRNRTLTGSASSDVVGISESKAQLKSARVHAHDLARKRRHLGALFVTVLGGATMLFWLISEFTAGVVVKAQDVSIQLDPIYEKTIQEYLGRQPTERFRFLLNKDNLNDYLQEKAPEIAGVAVDGVAGFGKSSFILTLRTPTAGWSVAGKQQYVDGSGTSFEKNYFSTPSVQIVDKSGAEAAAGQAVASNRFLGFVGRVVGVAKSHGYKVTQVTIPHGTTRQVELRIEGIVYPIKFSVDRMAGEQVEDMDRSVKWLATKTIVPAYLDVRISGKAFYR